MVGHKFLSAHAIVKVGTTSVKGKISSTKPMPAIAFDWKSVLSSAASTGGDGMFLPILGTGRKLGVGVSGNLFGTLFFRLSNLQSMRDSSFGAFLRGLHNVGLA